MEASALTVMHESESRVSSVGAAGVPFWFQNWMAPWVVAVMMRPSAVMRASVMRPGGATVRVARRVVASEARTMASLALPKTTKRDLSGATRSWVAWRVKNWAVEAGAAVSPGA